MLFNTDMNKLPLPPNFINIAFYADGTTLITSHPQVEKLCDNNSIPNYFTRLARIMKSYPSDPHLTVNNSPIPGESKVKVLGVLFDSVLIIGEYVKKTPKRNYKSAITYWKRLPVAIGAAQRRLSVPYKAIGWSVLNYGALIWASTISNKNKPSANATKLCLSNSYWLCKNDWHQWHTQWGWNANCQSSHWNVSRAIPTLQLSESSCWSWNNLFNQLPVFVRWDRHKVIVIGTAWSNTQIITNNKSQSFEKCA